MAGPALDSMGCIFSNSIPIYVTSSVGCSARVPLDLARGLHDLGLNHPLGNNKHTFIAHSDGFELLKILDVENNPLTIQNSKGTQTRVDLEQTEST